MKIAEIKEIPTNDLVERVEAEVTNYNQMVLNHSISPFYCSAQPQFFLFLNFLLPSSSSFIVKFSLA